MKTTEGSVADKLDSLNARLRARGNAPDRIRRSLEAQIESKAKRRRGREVAASSAVKRRS